MAQLVKVDGSFVCGQNARWSRVLGDIQLAAQYVEGEPALVMWKAGCAHPPGAYVVCLSSAYHFTDPKYMVSQARIAAHVMGFSDSMTTTHKIVTIIHDHLDELVHMLPELSTKEVVAELKLAVDGGGYKYHEAVQSTGIGQQVL